MVQLAGNQICKFLFRKIADMLSFILSCCAVYSVAAQREARLHAAEVPLSHALTKQRGQTPNSGKAQFHVQYDAKREAEAAARSPPVAGSPFRADSEVDLARRALEQVCFEPVCMLSSLCMFMVEAVGGWNVACAYDPESPKPHHDDLDTAATCRRTRSFASRARSSCSRTSCKCRLSETSRRAPKVLL